MTASTSTRINRRRMEVTRTLLLVAAAVSLPAATGFTSHANNKYPLTLQLRQLHQEAALTSLSMLSDQEAWELAQEQQQQQSSSFSRGKAHTQVAASGGPTTYRPDSISHGNARVGPSTTRTRHERRRQRPTPKAAAINRGSSTKMRWESSASTSRAPPPPPPVQQRQRSQPPTSHRGTTRQQQQQQPKRSYFSDMPSPSPHRPRQAQPRPVAREQPPPPQRPTTTATTTRQHPSPTRPVRNPYYRPAPEEEPPQVGRPYSPYGHTPVHHHHQQQPRQQSYYNQAPPQQKEAPPSEYKQQQRQRQQPPPEYRQQQQPQFQHDPTVATRAVMITNENRRILIEELGYPRRYVQAMNFEAARDIVAGRVRYQ